MAAARRPILMGLASAALLSVPDSLGVSDDVVSLCHALTPWQLVCSCGLVRVHQVNIMCTKRAAVLCRALPLPHW